MSRHEQTAGCRSARCEKGAQTPVINRRRESSPISSSGTGRRAGVPPLPPRRDPALNLAQETQMEIEHPAAPERRPATFGGWRRVAAVAALSVGLLVVGGGAVVLAASPHPAVTQAPATSQAPAATGGAGQPSQSGNGPAGSGSQRQQSGTQGAGRHNCPGTGNGGGAARWARRGCPTAA